MKPLNDKEREMYEYIRETIKNEGYAPTVRDIRASLGIKSTATVHLYLQKLEDKGYIVREQGKSRTIRIDGAKEERGVPLLGQIAAGLPIFAQQNFEGYVDFRRDGVDKDSLFALKVKGESMIDAGIMDGDTIIVQATPTAENGQVVAALVEDEATVKEFYREDGHFRLQPRNPDMAPIIVDEVRILGKVIACLRYYD